MEAEQPHKSGQVYWKEQGIKEVVEWIQEHGRMTYERAYGEITFDASPLSAWRIKLKEWGIEK